jgi:hypothetical protein
MRTRIPNGDECVIYWDESHRSECALARNWSVTSKGGGSKANADKMHANKRENDAKSEKQMF